MSAAKQFKPAVTSEAVPIQGWRGGLERSRARWGIVVFLVRGKLPTFPALMFAPGNSVG
jgi:hypothetical protein